MTKHFSAKRILGVDPGTRVTGFGIIDCTPHKLQVVDYGCIRTPPKAEAAEKYFIIFRSLEELLLKHRPEAVAIESQFVYKNTQSALKLGMAKGAAFIACAKNAIPIFEYTPTKAKLAVTGYGNAGKEQVQKMMQLILNLNAPPSPDDAADALGLALCHWQNFKWRAANF